MAQPMKMPAHEAHQSACAAGRHQCLIRSVMLAIVLIHYYAANIQKLNLTTNTICCFLAHVDKIFINPHKTRRHVIFRQNDTWQQRKLAYPFQSGSLAGDIVAAGKTIDATKKTFSAMDDMSVSRTFSHKTAYSPWLFILFYTFLYILPHSFLSSEVIMRAALSGAFSVPRRRRTSS